MRKLFLSHPGWILLVTCYGLTIEAIPATADNGLADHPPTQGEFALALAKALGHDMDDNGDSAIELLSSLSIIPGVGPNARWEAGATASTKFVADLQASVQLMLKRVAEKAGIAPPPTLDLFVFELPPAPQKIYFPANGPGGAGRPSGAPKASVGVDTPALEAPPDVPAPPVLEPLPAIPQSPPAQSPATEPPVFVPPPQ